ncbi:MAG: hypothetical protein SchgKO_07280 [Schleiferiaceae bacterium]
MKTFLYTAAAALMIACSGSPESQSNNDTKGGNTEAFFSGDFRMELHPNDSVALPFVMNFGPEVIKIYNGGETLEATEFKGTDDSLYIDVPVFNSALIVTKDGDAASGYFTVLDRDDYRIDLTGEKGNNQRFKTANANASMDGAWKTQFFREGDDGWIAKGTFSQKGSRVTGTFQTNTGDYRFLEGQVSGNDFEIYGFDGITSYSFIGTIEGDSLRGNFYSGMTGFYPFAAAKDPSFALDDPNRLTYMLPDAEEFAFAFPAVNPDLNKATVTSNQSTQTGKVTVIQISGSWCHNCMDETRFFVDLYDKYNESGMDVYGICFERYEDYDKASSGIQKMIKDLNIPYPMLFAGKTGAENTKAALPMINHVMSYPTSIFIDKKGQVRRIHTGFAGPGTQEYDDLIQETEAFVVELLNE